MTAAGKKITRLTYTPDGQASSQPTWWPDRSRMLFRRSGPGVSSMWTMGTDGEDRRACCSTRRRISSTPASPPTRARSCSRPSKSPTGDTDRGIETMPVAGGEVKTLFDFPGAFDSAPAWSPDGTRIAFESNLDVFGVNPTRDSEIWVMNADGSNPVMLTDNNGP